MTQPANGTVVITGGGTGLTYQPNPNYCNNPPGTTLDTFTYTLNGGSTRHRLGHRHLRQRRADRRRRQRSTRSATPSCESTSPPVTTPTVTETTATGTGVRGNDADHPAENDPFTVTSIVGCADIDRPV